MGEKSIPSYKVDAKLLSQTIAKCLSVISLGERSDTNVVSLIFTKRGITVEALNSMAEFSSDLPVEVENGVKTRISIIPEMLQSFTKNYKSLILTPERDKLLVSSGKQFNASVFYVGQNEEVERRTFKNEEDISKITKIVNNILPTVSGIKNRTDGQPLGIIFSWGDSIELTVGDTHHAIVVDSPVKTKNNNSLTTSLPNLQMLMSVGSKFSYTDDRFYAYSDTEYLSIANKTDNLFLADMARSVIKEGKKTTKIIVKTDEFKAIIDTITSAISETEVVKFNIEDTNLVVSINTSAGSAKATLKHGGVKGKKATVMCTIHHLKDCISAMKEKTTTIFLMNNTMIFESSNKEVKISSALTVIEK